MRKIIGIGETILDVIFRKNKKGEMQPTKAVPGGSTFNTLISLGRLGISASLVTELGDDHIGKDIIRFMNENGVGTDYIDIYNPQDGKTPVSLAFLDENNNAQYTFYHQFPDERLNVAMPLINEGDIVIFGSYFSLNPQLRQSITEILEFAKTRKAIIYYDPNFRPSHSHEAMKLMPSIIENLEYADIVRGSADDFEVLFKITSAEKTYLDKIKFYCPNFIYTAGEKGVELFCNAGSCHFDTPQVETVSTIGAGDTFNAGILFGLIRHNITLAELYSLTLDKWASIIGFATEFAAAVCQSDENYLPLSLATAYRQ